MLQFLKARKLLAVIERHRLDFLRRQCLHRHNRRPGDRLGRFVGYFYSHRIPRLALDVGDNKTAAFTAFDRIAFPTADTLTFIDHLGTLINHMPIRHLHATILTAATFTPAAMVVTQIPIEVAAFSVIAVYPTIDGYMSPNA